MAKTKEIKCNICGSEDYKVLYEGSDSGCEDVAAKYSSSSNDVSTDRIVKCNECSLVYVNPQVEPGLILAGYSGGTDEKFVSQAHGREITFKKSLKMIEKFAKKGKVLDIGTAGGSFLHVAKEAGWEVYGIEPNKWLCSWGKKNYGIDIKSGTLFDNKYKSDFFDVITLWDVLEHVTDPRAYLDEINRILKPGGLLVVNYPDIGSLVAKTMKKKWFFMLAVHLFYFTPDTIKKILNKTGFEVFKTKMHFQTLSLGYLAYRINQYSKFLSELAVKAIKFLKIQDTQIPYWVGQTLVLARKVKNLPGV